MAEEWDIQLARQGDTAAFERLATPCEAAIWRLCWHMMGNREDAQDVAQEAMLKAWQGLKSFQGDCAFSTWLYRIATRCCLDALRKQQRRPAASMEALAEEGYEPKDPAPLPQEALEQREHRQAVQAALDSLPEEQRQPLVLCCVEGRDYEEAAACLGLPVGTVKSRISRGRSRLKEILSENGNKSLSTASNTVKGGRKA